jgi:hypothetical protein
VKLTSLLSSTQFDKTIKFLFLVLITCPFLANAGYSPFFSTEKQVIFFAEPSHYCLVISPFFLYMMLRVNFAEKFALLVLSLAIGYLLKSLIFFVVISIVAIFSIRLIILFLLILCTLVLQMVFNLFDFHYYLVRLNFLNNDLNNINLSTLVYLSSWERVTVNLVQTLGQGVGFQNLGFIDNLGNLQKSIIINNKYLPLSVYDGSFLACKILVEFGIYGLVLLLVYIFYLMKISKIIYLESFNKIDKINNKILFCFCCYIMFIVDIFVRGIGYFSTSSFLFITALLIILKKNLENNYKL